MLSAPPTNLEASLLQRWFPVSPPGSSTLAQHKRFSETDLRDISDVLQRVGRGTWSRIPRIYAVLRLLDRLDVIDLFLAQAISDVYFPFTHQTLPQSLNPSAAHGFLQVQRVVLSSALDLERETGRHRHFSSTDDVPFIKVEDLGKGAYGYVDRVISTVSYKEYARKLIPRGRTFQRDQKILRDFERELGTLKKLSHHRHVVQLVGSYTDPRFVGIVMSPVAECDLKDFLNNCASDAKGTNPSSKSFIRSFFGCLTSALSYLHDNTIRHKDIKPQNVLVSQHTVFLTDFGISLDWSEIGQSTTTGPTPRTARYCAPEVSDYAPRNTSSDMWSLGCIFLEIWTVLKGETVANLHAYLEANDTLSSCYHMNCDATLHWMKTLESMSSLADNPPQEWIRHLIVPEQRKRWTARQLLSEIETVNSNPEAKFAFSGQCCMDELESAESVISSDESFHETGVGDTVPQPSLLAAHSVHKRGKEERPEALSGALTSEHDIAARHLFDDMLSPVTIEPKADDGLSRDENVTTPSALDVFQRQRLSHEDGVLLAVGNSPEKMLHADNFEKPNPDSSGTISQNQAVDSERSHSTHPDVFLSAAQPSSEVKRQDASDEHTLQPHGGPRNIVAELTFEHAVDSTTETVYAPAEDLGGNSVIDVEGQAERLLKSSSLTDESTAAPTTSGNENLLRQYSVSDHMEKEELISTALVYSNSRAQQHPIEDMDAQQWPLPAHSQLSIMSSSANVNSTHQSDDTTLDPFADHGIPTNSTRTIPEDGPLKDATSERIEGDAAIESNLSHWYQHQPTTHRDSRTSTPPSPRSPTWSFDWSRTGASPPPELSVNPSTDIVPYKPPQTPDDQVCAKCHEVLTGQFVRALLEKFHLECFTCADCGRIVAINPPEGHTQEIPLCETDYFRRLELLCHTCGEALRGSYITALDHKYHLEHFVCEEPGCGHIIGQSEHYYEHEEAAYCRHHFLKQHAQLCHGCGTAICAQFVEIFRNRQNQMWHPECYMIDKYWNVRLKNEFAEVFAKHEHPRENGLELPQNLVEASIDQTSELIAQVWKVLSTFEESCATSLSDMLLHATPSDCHKALSTSAYFILKIEGLFIALDELDRLKRAQEQTSLIMAREQRLLCVRITALFALLASPGDKGLGVSQELISLVTELARYLKLLIRIGVQAAWSLDAKNKLSAVPKFLANINEITQNSMQSKLQIKIRDNDYVTRYADFCNLCQKSVNGVGSQGCYWTGVQIYHIDCIKCPSCNNFPRVVNTNEGDCVVECSYCNHGSILAFIAQNLGKDFVILHSKSLVSAHLLYVGWARLAQALKPNVAPSLIIAAEAISRTSKETTGEGSNANSKGDSLPPPPSCPQGWKAYWSTPARKYLFMNLQTGVSQWESPDSSNDTASDSQEIVLHRPAPGHNPQDSEPFQPRDFYRYSLTLEDIPRIVAAEHARETTGLSSSAANAMNKSKSDSRLPQIVLSPSIGNTLVGSSGMNSSTTSFDGLGVSPEGKKKGGFFSKWKRKSGAFI